MKFEITEDKIISVMLTYLKDRFPEAAMPLKSKLYAKGRGNSGWGSSMHDYTYYETRYFTEDGTVIVIETDDRDSSKDSQWLINAKLEGLYDLFGDRWFEYFFKTIHNIDILYKGNKKYDWFLDDFDWIS